MSALADLARRRAREAVLAMTPEERVMLAFRLGDDDLRLHCAASGLSEEAARERLRAARSRGRRPSSCANGAPR